MTLEKLPHECDAHAAEANETPANRRPLRVMFLITSMPVGGAETLLVNLIRRMDRTRFAPELCCLKELGPLGEVLAEEIPAHWQLLGHRLDVRVLPRIVRLLRRRRIDAIVTVGAGDKMFWGRLAAWLARVPVVISALHSTGWPDGIGRLNRMLTRITDAFVGVATPHGQHLVEVEGFPAHKVRVIPNGVDCDRFAPVPGADLRETLGLPEAAPVAAIVAALRPEKNHGLFLQSAALVLDKVPQAQFLIIGDGPERPYLELLAAELGITENVKFLGTRADIPRLLALCDVFVLTSHIEANPVSILEAMASGKPVVATRVGSVAESVLHGQTGYLVGPGDARQIAARVLALFDRPIEARKLGAAGREQVVSRWSLQAMVEGYQSLICELYEARRGRVSTVDQPAVGESGTTRNEQPALR